MKRLLIIVAVAVSLASCAPEIVCPVEVSSDFYAFKKTKKSKYGPSFSSRKKKPSPSLVHMSRESYRPTRH